MLAHLCAIPEPYRDDGTGPAIPTCPLNRKNKNPGAIAPGLMFFQSFAPYSSFRSIISTPKHSIWSPSRMSW